VEAGVVVSSEGPKVQASPTAARVRTIVAKASRVRLVMLFLPDP
jgi:hypothetical protein